MIIPLRLHSQDANSYAEDVRSLRNSNRFGLLGQRFYSKHCWSQRFSLWWQKVLQLYGLRQEFEGRNTRHVPVCALFPGCMGISTTWDRIQSSKKFKFQERVKVPHRLRFARVLWLKQNMLQEAPALFCFCRMGELGSLVMSTCIYTWSVLIWFTLEIQRVQIERLQLYSGYRQETY